MDTGRNETRDKGVRDMDQIRTFVDQYKARYIDCKEDWNYEDGCLLKGLADLYRTAGDPSDRQWVLSYLARRVDADGAIPSFRTDNYNIDAINCGKALFFALDETGDERYRKAADFLHARLADHPRCATGNYWHKDIYPNQVWLDGLYMAQPFRAEYDRCYLSGLEAADIARQFKNVRKYLFSESRQLYYHACDLTKAQPWADPKTGCSPNFWLRAMGWYLMALVDCVDAMAEQLYEHRRALMDLFLEAVRGILLYADPDTGLFYQVIDRADVPGNYLETSGSAMAAYALMKGVRLGLLDPERYLAPGVKAFRSLADSKLAMGEDGQWHLNDICLVAGLGPGEKRDGSVAYYLSEKVGSDDPKGVGPFMMAWSEYLRLHDE